MCVACFDWSGPLGADYERVLDQLTLDGFSPRDSINYYIARALRGFMHDDATRQRVYWDSARVVSERVVAAEPADAGSWEQLGMTYAGSRRAPDAAKAVRKAEELYRIQGDTAWLRPFIRQDWTINLTLLADRGAAAESLAAVLSDTTFPYLTLAAVRVDPFYGRLKGVPRFDRLVGGP
jgi:hypothetical protein